MISQLYGTIIDITPHDITLDVHDIGYTILMTNTDLQNLTLHQQTRLYTTLTISQENLTLYGFLTPNTKALFTQLQKVSGVGPKAALAILSTLDSNTLITAINTNDIQTLTRAPGIGKKGAQKIILELTGKITTPPPTSSTHTITNTKNESDIIIGLQNLGWPEKDAIYAVTQIKKQNHYTNGIPDTDIRNVLKAALLYLGEKKRS